MPDPATPSASDADLEVLDLQKRWGRHPIVSTAEQDLHLENILAAARP